MIQKRGAIVVRIFFRFLQLIWELSLDLNDAVPGKGCATFRGTSRNSTKVASTRARHGMLRRMMKRAVTSLVHDRSCLSDRFFLTWFGRQVESTQQKFLVLTTRELLGVLFLQQLSPGN
jgi:hypothetical protein